MSTNRRYLVMARVGNRSLHRHWLEGEDRNFDLYLSYFGDERDKYAADCEFWRERKGPKWPILHNHIAEEWDMIKGYDAVWLPDDDLLMDATAINRMFDFCRLFDLSLAQPALSHESYYTHSSLLQRPGYVLRYCNFVEVMAPVFRADTLALLRGTFGQSKSGWGLDNLWPHLLAQDNPHHRLAILDAVPMTHTRPVGGELYKNNPSMSAEADKGTVQALYPELDLNRRSHANKFRVLGGVREYAVEQDLKAFLIGKYQRITNKHLARQTPKYQPPQA